MSVKAIETKLNDLLNKNAPVKLPDNAKKSLAGVLWVVALVVGILDLLATYWLWQAGHVVNKLVDYTNAAANYYGFPATTVQHLGLFYYLALVSMAVVGVLLLLAAPGLKAMKKKGWDMLFYATLVQAVLSVVSIFSSVRGGVGGFISSALGAVIGAYFLFQVRDYFKEK